jgi:phage FluMu protein Com
MEKQINCTACGRGLKISGPAQGTKEVMQPVTCPACKTPNEVSWPIASGVYTVTLL